MQEAVKFYDPEGDSGFVFSEGDGRDMFSITTCCPAPA